MSRMTLDRTALSTIEYNGLYCSDECCSTECCSDKCQSAKYCFAEYDSVQCYSSECDSPRMCTCKYCSAECHTTMCYTGECCGAMCKLVKINLWGNFIKLFWKVSHTLFKLGSLIIVKMFFRFDKMVYFGEL